MQVAIIGTGSIAQVHAESILSLGHQITLIVGHTLASAEKFSLQYPWAMSLSYSDFLFALTHYESNSLISEEELFTQAWAKIDCIHICTPPAYHYQVAKLALLTGKHVICEKPLTLDPQEGEELYILAGQKNLIGAVNFNVRFYEACEQMKAMVQAPEFGEILLIKGHYLQEFHMLPTPYSWRYQSQAGGALRATSEIGSHIIDLIRFVTGAEIEAASGVFKTHPPKRYIKDNIMYAQEEKPDKEVEQDAWEKTDSLVQTIDVQSEDIALIQLKLTGGGLASLVLSEISPGRKNDLFLEVTSEKESVAWSSENPYTITRGLYNKGLTHHTFPFGGGFTTSFRDFFRTVYQQIEVLKQKIEQGLESKMPEKQAAFPNFRDGAINSKICQCIWQSAKQGGTFVPLLPQTKIQRIIQEYNMVLLPVEHTYIREIYFSASQTTEGIPVVSSMYGLYCNEPLSVSCFHRLERDEIWHFYEGDPIVLYLLHQDGRCETVVLGADKRKGQVYQFAIPAGVWQAGCLQEGGDYALYGCTVSPAFTPDCFEAAVAEELIVQYPQMAEIIKKLDVNQGARFMHF